MRKNGWRTETETSGGSEKSHSSPVRHRCGIRQSPSITTSHRCVVARHTATNPGSTIEGADSYLSGLADAMAMTGTTIHCCLFDGVDELDVLGPYEVFSCAQRTGASIEPTVVGLDSTAPIQANHGTTIEPQATLGTPDVVVVPGGGWSDDEGGVRVQVEDGALGDRLVQLHGNGTVIASVCTGAMVLAHAGLLDGKTATTHETAKRDLEAFDAITVSEDRYVDADDVLTAGGVTSGIDLALHLTERFGDEATAETVASELAYDRARSV